MEIYKNKTSNDIYIVNEYGYFITQKFGPEKPIKHYMKKNIKDEDKVDVDDLDLFKISHHQLTYEKHNVYTTKKTIEKYLTDRGFVFKDKKWRKEQL
jgi:hypothetical protein